MGQNTNPTKDEMLAEITALRAQNAALKAKDEARANRPVTFKVSDKKALSAYGMGRFPVTLYKSQWKKLIASIPALQAALTEHDAVLADKPETPAPKV
jgi:hypothetical protein